MINKKICFLVIFTVFLLRGVSLLAQDDRITLKIVVTGPGDQLYFWWGHIALVIEDSAKGTSLFYDWGVFSFDEKDFFVDFAFGRLTYLCAVSQAERNFRRYTETNRDITVYTLDLPLETKEKIKRLAEDNIRPENRAYEYHHFYQNCSTRIRDILDIAVTGQFKQKFGNAPGRYTLRQHVRRHTWFSPFMDWILNFWMGQDIDTPITIWDEMFLPSEVGKRIQDFSYFDENGVERKLVSAVEVLNKSVNRPPVLDVPRRQWDRELMVGLLLAVILVFFQFLQRRKPRLGRVLFGLSQSAMGLFFGIVGLILFFMTFFTNHDYTYHNANVIFVNPLLLIAIPCGIRCAFCKNGKKRFVSELILRCLWTYVALGGVLTMIVKLFPGFYQQNQVTQALVIPFALASSFAGDLGCRLLRMKAKPSNS
ncbi:MAG: DUF4105 domain-containing protein [Treponema sp.]|jgi:hypothetical protein|nr:DUF4105 domain-containing protein [Treponema sp.]